MICLDIKVKNEYNDYLNKLFNGINLSNYVWEIHADDFLYSENGAVKENLFGRDVLTGEEFYKCISRDSYYMIFADIKAYPIDKERVYIKTVEDFLESNCEMVLLCTDSVYIEFYCKSREILDRINNNCKGDNFLNVEFKPLDDISERILVAW